MDENLKVLMIDAQSSFYRVDRYKVGEFFGPVDLGLFLSGKYNSLNIGTGLLAGSIFPGSNRLIFTGFSPAWGGFYVSSMGGAGLVFDNLGINMFSIVGRASTPSVLYLNRIHGEEIQVELYPINVKKIWSSEPGGIYSLMEYVYNQFGGKYLTDPRILATGPAADATNFGGIASCPIENKKLTPVDTWAGRGGFGSKLVKEHNIYAIIYGGTYIDEDFRDKKVVDQWFVNKYQKKMAAKDIEANTKYRFDPKFQTGGTFGVNYHTMGGRLLAFNYKSLYMSEDDRIKLHKDFILNHYLKQFNEETIIPKKQKTCGEPCVAVCKKMNGIYKKDYEPYQTMGPLSGIFDQRAAEKLVHHADMYGFDAISVGGVISWLMENLVEGKISPEELGISKKPIFDLKNFDVIETSMHNASVSIEILDAIIEKRGILDLSNGARQFAKNLAREKGKEVFDSFVYVAFARRGWVVPNQYWTPGALSPMPIMGKYYMYYGPDFLSPRELGRVNAERFKKEIILDNIGMCRFHRGWAEDMMPDVIESLYGLKDRFLESINILTSRINSRNASVFWESARTIDFLYEFIRRKVEVEGNKDKELLSWFDAFNHDKNEAALSFWYEIHKGIQESLREF